LALPIFVWLPTWIPQLVYFHRHPESGASVLVEELGKQIYPAHDLVVVSFEVIAPQVHRYLRRDVRMVSFPDFEGTSVIRWAGLNDRLRDDQRLHKLIAMMDETLGRGGSIWVIESVHDFVPIGLNYPMQNIDFNTAKTIRMCQIRTWLLQHAKQLPIAPTLGGKTPQDVWAPGREFPIMASRFSRQQK
jgi:hypothetical protein